MAEKATASVPRVHEFNLRIRTHGCPRSACSTERPDGLDSAPASLGRAIHGQYKQGYRKGHRYRGACRGWQAVDAGGDHFHLTTLSADWVREDTSDSRCHQAKSWPRMGAIGEKLPSTQETARRRSSPAHLAAEDQATAAWLRELSLKVGDGDTGKAAYRGGAWRLHFLHRGKPPDLERRI